MHLLSHCGNRPVPRTVMTTQASTWRVGIFGLSHAGVFLSERLGLTSDIRVTGIYDSDPARRAMVASAECIHWENPLAATVSRDVDAVFFMHDLSTELVSSAL